KGYEFYRKDTDGVDNQADINKIVGSIQTSGSYSGAMGVEYREITKLNELIKNLEKRFSHPFKLVMITLEAEGKNDTGSHEAEKAMYYMEQAILQTIRDVDIMTRYNKLQFLVILLGTDQDGVTSAVDRIFRGYYKMNGSGSYSPSYTIEGE
ncbi:MAG: diguanylate cyclase, partial [Eubacterium sp.]|nr:diguanylate cyclase [Eubacterium sp.]